MFQTAISCLLLLQMYLPGEIPAGRVPEPVKKALYTRFPKAADVRWEKEEDKYEAEMKVSDAGREHEISMLFAADGTLLETETELDVVSLPPAVQRYLASHFPGKKVKEAAVITDQHGQVLYEAEIGGKDYLFTDTGLLVTGK